MSRLSGQHTEAFQMLLQGHRGRGHLSPVGWLHTHTWLSPHVILVSVTPVKGRELAEPKIISPINICVILAFLVAAWATDHLISCFGAGILISKPVFPHLFFLFFLAIQRWKMFSVNICIYDAWKDFKDWLGGRWQCKRISTHTLWHLHTLSFLKGERSVSRGRNGEPLLWLITRQGPGRTLCHFHCHTHYTKEEVPPPPRSHVLSNGRHITEPSSQRKEVMRDMHVEGVKPKRIC